MKIGLHQDSLEGMSAVISRVNLVGYSMVLHKAAGSGGPGCWVGYLVGKQVAVASAVQ